jgi:hypothetical protein
MENGIVDELQAVRSDLADALARCIKEHAIQMETAKNSGDEYKAYAENFLYAGKYAAFKEAMDICQRHLERILSD